MLNKLEEIDVNGVENYVIARQNPDGSFGGDESNEIDTRFSFCAIAALYLIVSFSHFQCNVERFNCLLSIFS